MSPLLLKLGNTLPLALLLKLSDTFLLLLEPDDTGALLLRLGNTLVLLLECKDSKTLALLLEL